MTGIATTADAEGLSFLANVCAYERYDPETLEPHNNETRIRLAELNWSRADFEGKTVLDVGAGGGFLSLQAHRLGATSVHACDVQGVLVSFFRNVVDAKQLPITVSKASLADLRSPRDQADVVLFMQVLHWAVAQGMRLEAVIDQLARLTRECLFIEFPWSVDEPSIMAQTKLTDKDYAPDRVLDLLSRHFQDVKIVRFMHYFGFRSQRKRVLVRATRKRIESAALMALPEARPLDVSLPNARHRNRVLYSPAGYFFLKQLAPESRLRRIDSAVVTALFDDLHQRNASTLVLPVRLGDAYVVANGHGAAFMVFPLIGGLADQPTVSRRTLPLDRLLGFLNALRGELSSVALPHLDAFRDPNAISSLTSIAKDPEFWRLPPCAGVWKARIEGLLEVLGASEGSELDRLQHGDVQTGNLLEGQDGRLMLVDLDSLYLGTPYADGLTALVWYGADAPAFMRHAETCASAGEREIRPLDLALSAIRSLNWLLTVTKGKMLDPGSRTITCFLTGFDGLMKFDGAFRRQT